MNKLLKSETQSMRQQQAPTVATDELSVQCIDSLELWHALSAEWDRLAILPMHQSAWLQAWWKHVGQSTGRLAIGCVRLGSDVIGFAPLYLTRTWKGNSLQFLGSGLTCTDYLDLLCRAEDAKIVGQTIARWVQGSDFRRRFGRVDLIELEGHTAVAPGTAILQSELDSQGWQTETKQLENCWVVSFQQDWNEHLNALSHRQRRRARNAEKLIRDQKMRYNVHDQLDDFNQVWDNFVVLHQKRRHDKGQSGCFAEAGFEGFLKEAAQKLMARQQAMFTALYLEDQPLAMGLQLRGLDRFYLYQTGMDVDHIKLEPGHVLNALSLQHTWKSGVLHYDFLRGDEPYKARWNAQPTPLVRTRLWNTHLSAKLRAQLTRSARTLKQWLQRPVDGTASVSDHKDSANQTEA